MNDEQYPGPPDFILYPTLPPAPRELPRSRRFLEIYTDNGVCLTLLAIQDLPDDIPQSTSSLTYSDKVLDLSGIYQLVPEEFHLAIHNYLGSMSQQDYNANVSEIIITWAL